MSETVEWALATLVAPLELYCAIVSGYYLSFKLSGKVVFLLGPELPTGDGWERAVLHHWRLFFSIRFEFQVIRKGCEGSGDDSWSDAESLCDYDGNSNVKCGEVVSGKRCVV